MNRPNGIQALVIGFFAVALAGLVAILAVAPGVYDRTLELKAGSHLPVEIAFVAALTGFLALLSVGVLRRWRWTFWLILVAFLAGVVRVPVTILQLTGTLTAAGPTWYVVLQGVIGLVQVAIGLVMLQAWRRAGVWGVRR
jgi:hypothetical protein